jgi:hypothetical protein
MCKSVPDSEAQEGDRNGQKAHRRREACQRSNRNRGCSAKGAHPGNSVHAAPEIKRVVGHRQLDPIPAHKEGEEIRPEHRDDDPAWSSIALDDDSLSRGDTGLDADVAWHDSQVVCGWNRHARHVRRLERRPCPRAAFVRAAGTFTRRQPWSKYVDLKLLVVGPCGTGIAAA